jgi:hypothetical protein
LLVVCLVKKTVLTSGMSVPSVSIRTLIKTSISLLRKFSDGLFVSILGAFVPSVCATGISVRMRVDDFSLHLAFEQRFTQVVALEPAISKDDCFAELFLV